MNKEAVLHSNTETFVYPIARNQLIVRLRTAKKEIKKCQIIYWNREDSIKKRETMECYARDELFDYFQCKIIFTKVARYQKYYFWLEETHREQWYFSSCGITSVPPSEGFFEYLYANQNDVRQVPNWAKGIIYYQIFPDRFFNGNPDNDPADCKAWGTIPTRNNYMGGDLKGICNKLPYLKDLGVECLYLNPVFEGDFNHKYATTDYFRIDPLFGTNEELKELISQCHQQGIRIILDGVFNHTGIHFPLFQNVLEKQEQSAYKDWFLIENYPVTVSGDSYECVGAYPYMPKLNTANPDVQAYILKIMDYWLGEYQIDGWRLDVADEVDSTVWELARITLKRKYPDCILLGETWGYGGRMLRGNQLDSVMNYMFRDAMWDYFGKSSISAEAFDHRINTILALYRDETCHLLYNLLDSHDTERFLYVCGENPKVLQLAAAFQMLFVGSPAIYYGDEAGITGENDPDCRRCMVWDEQTKPELSQWYKKIIAIRKNHLCVREGRYRTILADNQTNIFAFVRYHEEPEIPEKIYAVFNNSPEKRKILCPVLEDGKFVDLLSDEKELLTSKPLAGQFYNQDITAYKAVISLEMQPYAVKVFIKKGGYQHEEMQKSTGGLTHNCDLLGGVGRMR